MTNREITEVWMADVLSRLYDAWAGKIHVELGDTLEATKVSPEDPQEAVRLWVDLWDWLEKESIVRKRDSGRSNTRFEFAVLTAKGFEVLNKPAPGTSESLGSKMGDIAKTVGKEVMVEGAKTAAGEVVGEVMKATKVAEVMGAFFGSLIRGAASGG